MSRVKTEFNSEIKEILKAKNISIHDGITFLLSLHFGTQPSFIPSELEKRVLSTNIVSKDYSTNEVKWRISLFEEGVTGFEWVSDWMDLFKQVNPARRGVKKDVLIRMKRFFVNNPTVRKEDVMEATKNYLKSIDKPVYCKKSHKFIYEIDGSSMLTDFVGQLEEQRKRDKVYNSDII